MTKLDFLPIQSSQIKEIAHDACSNTLFVKFKNNRLYSYRPVDKEKYQEFKDAESQGAYFHKNLKMNRELVIEQIKNHQPLEDSE